MGRDPLAVTVMPITEIPNQDKNNEMNSTIVATPEIRSASDQRAASNLYAGMEDAPAGGGEPSRRSRRRRGGARAGSCLGGVGRAAQHGAAIRAEPGVIGGSALTLWAGLRHIVLRLSGEGVRALPTPLLEPVSVPRVYGGVTSLTRDPSWRGDQVGLRLVAVSWGAQQRQPGHGVAPDGDAAGDRWAGHSGQGDGHVRRRELRNVSPASVLSATPPAPTAGMPTQVVPTMAHWCPTGRPVRRRRRRAACPCCSRAPTCAPRPCCGGERLWPGPRR